MLLSSSSHRSVSTPHQQKADRWQTVTTRFATFFWENLARSLNQRLAALAALERGYVPIGFMVRNRKRDPLANGGTLIACTKPCSHR